MKKILVFLSFLAFISMNSQVFFGNKYIRENAIKFPDNKVEMIENDACKDADITKKFKKRPVLKSHELRITIYNPMPVPVKFALGSYEQINIQEIKPNSFWSGVVNDYWQDFFIKTKGKELKSYSIRSNNCFSLVYEKRYNEWEIQRINCDGYDDVNPYLK